MSEHTAYPQSRISINFSGLGETRGIPGEEAYTWIYVNEGVVVDDMTMGGEFYSLALFRRKEESILVGFKCVFFVCPTSIGVGMASLDGLLSR